MQHNDLQWKQADRRIYSTTANVMWRETELYTQQNALLRILTTARGAALSQVVRTNVLGRIIAY